MFFFLFSPVFIPGWFKFLFFLFFLFISTFVCLYWQHIHIHLGIQLEQRHTYYVWLYLLVRIVSLSLSIWHKGKSGGRERERECQRPQSQTNDPVKKWKWNEWNRWVNSHEELLTKITMKLQNESNERKVFLEDIPIGQVSEGEARAKERTS